MRILELTVLHQTNIILNKDNLRKLYLPSEYADDGSSPQVNLMWKIKYFKM